MNRTAQTVGVINFRFLVVSHKSVSRGSPVLSYYRKTGRMSMGKIKKQNFVWKN